MGFQTVTLFILATICILSLWEGKGTLAQSSELLESTVVRLVQQVDTLQAKVATQEEELTQLRQSISQTEGVHKMAFTAMCQERILITATTSDPIINFNIVITNVGNAYDTSSGIFTSPYNGVYYFIVNVDVSADYEALSLNRNDEVVIWADKDDFVTTHVSASVVVNLIAGDIMSIRHYSGDKGTVDCGNDSTFSGFLIF